MLRIFSLLVCYIPLAVGKHLNKESELNYFSVLYLFTGLAQQPVASQGVSKIINQKQQQDNTSKFLLHSNKCRILDTAGY
jgi:hypothetical protein